MTKKYFLDTEFIEGFHKPWFGKRRHFIELISIGICCDDGREYYAVSTDFNEKDANDWVKQNVINQLPEMTFNGSNIQEVKLWKSNAQILQDLQQFVTRERGSDDVEVYGYYADYDWVLFCSLFGRMIDLPKGMPMHCIDLKQMLDEKIRKMTMKQFCEITGVIDTNKTTIESNQAWQIIPFKQKLDQIKKMPSYPKQTNEHNALADAKWLKIVK